MACNGPVLRAPGTAGWPHARRTVQTHSETGRLPTERPSKQRCNDRISVIDASANHLGPSEDQFIIRTCQHPTPRPKFLPSNPPILPCTQTTLGARRQTKRKKKEGERKHGTERLLSGPDPRVGEEDQMQLPPWLHAAQPAAPEGRRDGEQPGSLRRAQIIKSSDRRAGHIKKLVGLHVAPCCGHP